MKKIMMLCALMFILYVTSAFAFSFNPINWIKDGLAAGGWNLVAFILTAFFGLAIFGTIVFIKIINTMKEAGELLIDLSNALVDRKINPDEIKTIVNDIRNVFDIWKKTPDNYKPTG